MKASKVVNRFAKAGISKEQQNAALEEADADDVISADGAISVGDNVLSMEPLLTDDQIIDNIVDEETVDDATNDASEEPICPKATDVRNARMSESNGIVEDEMSVKLKQRDKEPSFSEKMSYPQFISVL